MQPPPPAPLPSPRPPAHRGLLWAGVLVLLWGAASACATTVSHREPAPEDGVAGMPWAPGTEEAVRAWAVRQANPRDLSLDLEGETPYVETALAASSPIPRVGFFFQRAPWRVVAVVYWLRPTEPPPPTGEEVGRLWGMPLLRTETEGERYAPAAHVLVRQVDASVPLPAQPRVDLPGDVPIKSPTRTFHRDHLYALVDGRIWFKRTPRSGGTLAEPWRLFGDGLPAPREPGAPFARPTRLVMLSADGDDLAAVDEGGRVYLCTTRSQSLTSVDGWSDGWGFPGKRPLVLEGRASEPRAFVLGRRAEHALWFEDAIGNRHHFGPMGTTTLYLLHRDGSELLFTDNGLPNDFSRQLCGPDDGRFVAQGLSASASALFLVDRYGRLLTRFDDYDLNGGTPNFEYTYRSVVRADEAGDSVLTSLSPYYLPLAPWRWHAPPVLRGRARLSRDLTVLQTGVGNAARELRVAGLGEDGARGYYTKGIEEEDWRFVPDDAVSLSPSHLLDADAVAQGAEEFQRTGGELAHSRLPGARTYRARWEGVLQVPRDGRDAEVEGVAVHLDWNPYCPPARLSLTTEGITVDVTLHTVDLWTPAKRVRPGFDGTPLLLLGTLVLEDALLTDSRPPVRRVVELLRRYHHANFAFLVSLEGDRVDIRALDEGPGHSHPIAWSLQRTGAWNPPEPPTEAGPARGARTWLRRGEYSRLTDAAGLQVDAEHVPLDALRSALEENRRLRGQLRVLFEAHAQHVKEVDAFREAHRLLMPLLPLGRLRMLPGLLSLQSVRGMMVSVDAQEGWREVEAQLSRRIAAYEATLGRRQAPERTTPEGHCPLAGPPR